MSLLLDALRRAAATRDDPKADRYTVPHRSTPEPAQGHDDPGAARDDDATAPHPTADPDGLALLPTTEPAVGSQTAFDPSRESAPRPAREPAAADSLLRAAAPPRPGRAGLMLGLAGSAVLAAGALAGGGWLWYQQSRQQIDDALGGYRPQLARAQAAAAAESDAAAPARTESQAPSDTAAGTSAVTAASAGGSGPSEASAETDRAADGPDRAAPDSAAPTPAAHERASQADAAADHTGEAAPSVPAGGVETARAVEPPRRTASDGAGEAPSTAPTSPPSAAANPEQADPGPANSDTASPEPASPEPARQATAEPAANESDGAAAATPRQARPLVQAVRGDPLADALDRGYRALRAGEVAVADEAYGRALRLAPGNRDALLGMAAVYQRRGRGDAARRLYHRVLDTHPRDAYARAALTALDGGRPRQNESELKLLLRDNPASPALHFALGNLYAAESRWAEAHQAYARAADAAPADPDFAYNLAVSLDHLGQRDAARLAYGRALGLAVGARPEFDANAVRHRLYQLRQGG